MTTAFVVSGGANPVRSKGRMLHVLADGGTTPDLIVDTSVGALNRCTDRIPPGADRVTDL
jgi:hypothetical protein